MVWLTTAIMVLVPFQALITTWPGSNLGHLDLLRIWKELLLIPLTLGALWLVYRDKNRFIQLFRNKLILIILFYILLHIGLGLSAYLSHKVNRSALIYGMLINLRFLVFFVDCLVVASFSTWLGKNWRQILLWPALIVISFGLLQHFVLPKDFLRHFGYGPKTIPAFQTVDQKPQYARLQSTLRGPNPLGAYLVLIITTAAYFFTKKRQRSVWAVYILLTSVVLFFTYSRSAWLGATLSVLSLAYYLFSNRLWRKRLTLALACIFIIFGGLILAFRNNNTVQNTFFHTDETSTSSQSTNQVHSQALAQGLSSLAEEPFGSGPGTAGPASARNDGNVRIAENYFVQIGQEVGIIGLITFLVINSMIFKYLWQNRSQTLPKVLAASLIGLTVINLISHAWTDDTLSILWWGLAGVALSPVILNKKRNRNEIQRETT